MFAYYNVCHGGCSWALSVAELPIDCGESDTLTIEAMFRQKVEHPADQVLRNHVLEEQNVQMLGTAETILADYDLSPLL